jgi:predicted nucleic acid-binding protein
VSKHIVLDSSPLSTLCLPTATPEFIAISDWAEACLLAKHRIYVPEIIDYELRRELTRAGKVVSIVMLNDTKTLFRYLPITTPTMLLAADLWAAARRGGFPTADPKKIDIDVILAAQALTLTAPRSDIIVATANIAHISRFVSADLRTNIQP